jgi:methionine biosynthesis protein MetW
MMNLKSIFATTDLENRRAILRLLSPQAGSSLLDCGCGDGTLTLQAAQRLQAAQVYGVDFLPEIVAACQSKGIVVSSKNLNEGLEFPSDSFDVVISNQVIEHLMETDLFVKEILRVLKPGGYTVVSTNNMASWHNIISLVLGMQPMPCYVSNEVRLGNKLDPTMGTRHPDRGAIHLRVFAYAALRDLFEHHGFTAVQVATSGYYPFPPRLAALLCKIDKWHGSYLILKAHKPLAH